MVKTPVMYFVVILYTLALFLGFKTNSLFHMQIYVDFTNLLARDCIFTVYFKLIPTFYIQLEY